MRISAVRIVFVEQDDIGTGMGITIQGEASIEQTGRGGREDSRTVKIITDVIRAEIGDEAEPVPRCWARSDRRKCSRARQSRMIHRAQYTSPHHSPPPGYCPFERSGHNRAGPERGYRSGSYTG